MKENSLYDKKSIRSITGKTADFSEIAKDAVAFSNAQGGTLEIGLEDWETEPNPEQRIAQDLITKLENKVSGLTTGVIATGELCTYENGGQTIKYKILRNPNTVASTTSGKLFVRIGDNSVPISGDDVARLVADKSGFAWEDQVTKYVWQDADEAKLHDILTRLRASDRVSDFCKEKTDRELLAYFFLIAEDSDYMTNLGVLFIGNQKQRGRISNAPNLQCIKYDEYGEKVNKWLWADYIKSPIEIIDEVWNDVPEWKESQEISDELQRRNIPAYDKDIIRELVCNALAHRPYTTRGDIFLNIHPQYIEITNPGRLPLGVTPDNILHRSRKRNEHMTALLYALHYMEKEGSGFDKIYEILLQNGKQLPIVKEGDDFVTVRVNRRVIKAEVANFMKYVSEHYHLRQKQTICLGLIAQHESLTARELEKYLELDDSDALMAWLQPLLKNEMVVSASVRGRGVEYRVNPNILQGSEYKGQTSLKRIEDYRLKELILEDLKLYQCASLADIQTRIGSEISERRIKYQLNKLIEEGIVEKVGSYRWTKYQLVSKE